MATVSSASTHSTQQAQIGPEKPIRLTLRSTFIDVEEASEANPLGRSKSEPILTSRLTVPAELQEEQRYVKSLAERARDVQSAVPLRHRREIEGKPSSFSRHKSSSRSRDAFSSTVSTAASFRDLLEATSTSDGDSFTLKEMWPDVEEDSVSQPSLGSEGFVASRGSFGHPHLCERACILAVAGRCNDGSECGFCHSPHTSKLHLDKRNRKILQAMPYSARAAWVLPIMEQTAREHDFGPACQTLLARLADEARRTSESAQPSKLPARKGLARVIAAMSFSEQLRHLRGGRFAPVANTDDVHALIEFMRCYVTRSSSAEHG
mmetsp:Transcript_51861/g.112441  ORF Transcript_51861/g.112441 Transcript_51861/m.112441 type:complete len:321 (+) Transcript_51861:145-1107(+)